MKTSIGLALGTLALAATAMSAQAPGTFNLQGNANVYDPSYTPQPIVSFGGHSYYSSPYTGAFVINNTPRPPFLVWCVDYTHESYFNTTYSVEVTSLTSDPLTYARDGVGSANLYDWAASFATEMTPLDFTTAADRQHDIYLQEAMWYAVSNGAYTNSDNFLSHLGLTAGFQNGAAPSHAGDGWYLIDGVGDGASYQEFLSYNPPGNPEGFVTPEPASLSLMGTGLAGVLGMGLRRRKNKKA